MLKHEDLNYEFLQELEEIGLLRGTVEVLFHQIDWWCHEKIDAEYLSEYVEERINAGFCAGELGNGSVRGWWNIRGRGPKQKEESHEGED